MDGTGAVPIRPVQQTVETPRADLSPNPFRAEPLIDTAAPAIEKAGGDLMNVFMQQKAHADAIDTSQRLSNFQQDFGQAKVAALNSGSKRPI